MSGLKALTVLNDLGIAAKATKSVAKSADEVLKSLNIVSGAKKTGTQNVIDKFPSTPTKWWRDVGDDGMVTMYHGTTADKVETISKEGLLPDANGFTYVAPDPHTGYGYSVMKGGEDAFKGKLEQAAGSERVLIELKIPLDEFDKMFPAADQRSKSSKALMFSEDSKEKFIQSGGKRTNKGYEGVSTYAALEARMKGKLDPKYITGVTSKDEASLDKLRSIESTKPVKKPTVERMELEEAGFGLTQFTNSDIGLAGGMKTASPSAEGVARLEYTIYDMKKVNSGTPLSEAKLGTTEINLKLDENGVITDTIEGLVNIKVDKSIRKEGLGRRIIESIKANSDGELNIYDIKPKAKGFWKKVGAELSSNGKKGVIK